MTARLQPETPGGFNSVPRYLTIEELAIATTLSVSTLRRLYQKGLIVGYQPGGPRHRILFPSDAVEQLTRPVTPSLPTPAPAVKSSTPTRGPRPKWETASELKHPNH
jgi:excisionase family DNA binding protein